MKKKRINQLIKYTNLFFILTLTPGIVFADSVVATVINNACDWLSGEIAGAISVLIVVWSGFEMLNGELEKKKFITRLVGVGLIYGGSYLAKSVFFKGVAAW